MVGWRVYILRAYLCHNAIRWPHFREMQIKGEESHTHISLMLIMWKFVRLPLIMWKFVRLPDVKNAINSISKWRIFSVSSHTSLYSVEAKVTKKKQDSAEKNNIKWINVKEPYKSMAKEKKKSYMYIHPAGIEYMYKTKNMRKIQFGRF